MTTSESVRQRLLVTVVAACVCGLYSQSFAAGGQAQTAEAALEGAGPTESKGELALIEVAPALYYTAKRYPKFYGDANTIHGSILERSFLLGNLNGTRDDLHRPATDDLAHHRVASQPVGVIDIFVTGEAREDRLAQEPKSAAAQGAPFNLRATIGSPTRDGVSTRPRPR